MGIVINGMFDVKWPSLIDARSGQLDGNKTVPWDSTAQALAALPIPYRAEGLILFVRNSPALEWWQFVEGVEDENLEKINFGGASTPLPYKVYSAWLTQTGTAAPVAVAQENTLGATVTWFRNGPGEYYCECTDKFTLNKTFILHGDNKFSLWGTSARLPTFKTVSDGTTINVFMYKNDGDTTGGDGYLQIFVEIRVYT